MIIWFSNSFGICIAPLRGTFWIRRGEQLCMLRAPWKEPMFSERYGYDVPKFKFCGWRYFRGFRHDLF